MGIIMISLVVSLNYQIWSPPLYQAGDLCLLLQHQHFHPHTLSSFLFTHRSVPQHFFWLILLAPKHSAQLWVLFFNHHSASGRLPSRKGSPLLGLPPNPSAACPSAFHAAHSPVLPTTCHSAPCHSSLNCGNIQHHCQSVAACVSKITLSRTLDDVSSYQCIWCEPCNDRQAPLDTDLSSANFYDSLEGA